MSEGTRITKRWIDADGIMRACYESFLKTNNKAYAEIVALIAAVPAADVVEVVRCRECIHWNAETKGCKRHPSVYRWYAKDFCSNGVK